MTIPAIDCTRLNDHSQVNGYKADTHAADIRVFAQQQGLTLREIIDEVRSEATNLSKRDMVRVYYARAHALPGQPFFPLQPRGG